MPAPRIVWTPEMDAVLREGAAASPPLGVRPLADKIGVCRKLVQRRRWLLSIPPAPRLGRPPRKKPDDAER